jgi:hypothetical protein
MEVSFIGGVNMSAREKTVLWQVPDKPYHKNTIFTTEKNQKIQ